MTAPTDLKQFFERYAEASLSDPATLATVYAPTFIVAGPRGSTAFPNDQRFLDWLAESRAFNERHGMQALEVVDIDTSELSPAHRLASVTWGAKFARTDDRRIEFRISYFVELAAAGPKILAYVSEADQEDEMRRHGLLDD